MISKGRKIPNTDTDVKYRYQPSSNLECTAVSGRGRFAHTHTQHAVKTGDGRRAHSLPINSYY